MFWVARQQSQKHWNRVKTALPGYAGYEDKWSKLDPGGGVCKVCHRGEKSVRQGHDSETEN